MNGAAARQARTLTEEWTSAGQFASNAWPSPDFEVLFNAKSKRRRTGLGRQISYIVIDFSFICLDTIFVFGVHFGISVRALPGWANAYPALLLLYATLIVMACMSRHLYRTARDITGLQETVSVAKAVGLATTLLALFIFLSGNKEISRTVVAWSGLLNFASLASWRYLKRRYILRRAQRGEGVSRALIIGSGSSGQAFAGWLESNRHLGYAVCGYLDTEAVLEGQASRSVLGVRNAALKGFADELFLVLPADRGLVKDVWSEARRLRLNLILVADIYDGLGWRAPIRSLGGFPLVELHGEPIPVFGLAVKRFIDMFLASIGLCLLSPVLFAAAAWIRIDSEGPAFYSALRVGRKGKKFRCLKLRTMVNGADTQKELLRESNERNGPCFKITNDPRVTPSGRFLRRFSVDEVPQLVNVLLGDMSLVGPRPHPVDDFERYSLDHLRRLDVKPGITGLWQVTARNDPSFETNMTLDLQYIENWTLWLDLKILLKTLREIFRGSGS